MAKKQRIEVSITCKIPVDDTDVESLIESATKVKEIKDTIEDISPDCTVKHKTVNYLASDPEPDNPDDKQPGTEEE